MLENSNSQTILLYIYIYNKICIAMWYPEYALITKIRIKTRFLVVYEVHSEWPKDVYIHVFLSLLES